MSAIFGIINKDGKPVDKEQVEKMQNSLLHRAVDGSSIYVDGNVMLGHHKLIVHRRMANEKQPLEIDDCVIVCDARVDNIDELFEELKLEKTVENYTDPFIILKCYLRWGNDCVNHLEGEFCFAVWKKVNKEFFSATDQIGFRTFYYYQNDVFFAFASEMKAIEAIKKETLAINKSLFINVWRQPLRPETFDKNIHILPAASYFNLQGKNRNVLRKYWQLKRKKEKQLKTPEKLYFELREEITKQIKNQINTDYPIGVLLSGGLDSSLITAITCGLLQNENKTLYAFCSVLPDDYDGFQKDERSYIETLKRCYPNLDVHYISPPKNVNTYSNLKEAFDKIEAPISIFHYVDTALYEAAREKKVRVLLSGFGGDETISEKGEGVIYGHFSNAQVMKAFRLISKKRRREQVGYLRLIKSEILRHFSFYRTISSIVNYDRHQREELPFNKEIIQAIRSSEIPSRPQFFDESVNSGELGYLLLLMKKNAQNFRLEHQSPLLNKNVIEMFLEIPGELLIKDGNKRALAKAIMHGIVPTEIMNRQDKTPLSPDYSERISVIEFEKLNRLLADKTLLEETTGIVVDKLLSQLTDLKENPVSRDVSFYQASAILIAEFYLWVKTHARKKKLL